MRRPGAGEEHPHRQRRVEQIQHYLCIKMQPIIDPKAPHVWLALAALLADPKRDPALDAAWQLLLYHAGNKQAEAAAKIKRPGARQCRPRPLQAAARGGDADRRGRPRPRLAPRRCVPRRDAQGRPRSGKGEGSDGGGFRLASAWAMVAVVAAQGSDGRKADVAVARAEAAAAREVLKAEAEVAAIQR